MCSSIIMHVITLDSNCIDIEIHKKASKIVFFNKLLICWCMDIFYGQGSNVYENVLVFTFLKVDNWNSITVHWFICLVYVSILVFYTFVEHCDNQYVFVIFIGSHYFYVYSLFSVVVWCVNVGTHDTGTAAVCWFWSLRNGYIPLGGLSYRTT